MYVVAFDDQSAQDGVSIIDTECLGPLDAKTDAKTDASSSGPPNKKAKTDSGSGSEDGK